MKKKKYSKMKMIKKTDKLKEDYFDNLSNKNWNKNYYNYDENVNGLCEYNFALGIFGNKKKRNYKYY